MACLRVHVIAENSMLLLYCCDPHYDLCFTIPSLPYSKLHGTCCYFSFINNPSVIEINSEALLSKGLFIWEEVIPVSEKTFRQVYERDLVLLRK